MLATLACPDCGGSNIDSGSDSQRHLWALLAALPLIALGLWLSWGWLTDPIARQGAALLVVLVPAIAGLWLLGYGLQREQVFTYRCADCGYGWLGRAKTGPAEGDPRRLEWQIKRLAHENPKERVEAAAWLGENKIDSAVEALILSLQDRQMKYANARQAAAAALGKIGDLRAVEPLMIVAEDDSWLYGDARLAAIEALGELGDPRARQALAAPAADEDVEIRQAAEAALARLPLAVLESYV